MYRFGIGVGMDEGSTNVCRFFKAARKMERRMIVDSAG
jgi:hypothetical protein